jgi:transposase
LLSCGEVATVLGRVSAQGSLLEARISHRHLLTPDSFYERLADHGHEFVRDDDFAHLYAQGNGRPSIPPSIMVRALLCAIHDRVDSDREIARRTRVDLDWKAAMGVAADFGGIGASTFSLFRARLVVHDADQALLERTLEQAAAAGVLSGSRTGLIDSSPVTGAGAVADTYTLIRKLLERLVRVAGDRVDEQTRAAAAPFLAGKPDIDWHDAAARKRHLGELVAAATLVRHALAGCEDPQIVEARGLLAAVIDQDVDTDDQGRPQIRRGVARDRIISHSDPEMRHGRKSASRRFDGHKLHVVTDEDSELVLGVDVGAGNGGDGEHAAPLAARVNDTLARIAPDTHVDTLVGDMAYSDGDVRDAVEQQAGAQMVAKVPEVHNGGRFPKTAFDIDPDAGTVTCPAGHTSTHAHACTDHKDRPAVRFRFDAALCQACPLRDRCVKGTRGRSITMGVHERRIQAARTAQHDDPDTVLLLRARAKVERKIDHLQDLGMRKARYRGRRKTRLQAQLAATVANLKRLAMLGAWAAPPTAAPQAA